MGLLSKIEEKLESVVEAPFKRLGELDPVVLFIAVRKAMAGKKKEIFGKTYIPNSCVVVMDEAVARSVAPFMDDFQRIIAARIAKWAEEMDYEVSGPPLLEFVTQDLGGKLFNIRVAYTKATPVAVTEEGADQTEEARGDEPLRSQAPEPWAELIDSNALLAFPLFEGGAVIGRDGMCDLQIADVAVSHKHARIGCVYGRWTIEDMESRNGTRVNHRSIKTTVLHDGDKIQIGSVELMFRLKGVKAKDRPGTADPAERDVQ